MYDIKRFSYKKEKFHLVKRYRYGENWPIVYILEDGKEAYVGESINAYRRAIQQFESKERAKLKNMYIIADDEYNKSATLDIESSLIKYMSGDGKYLLQNSNFGIQESDYYDRERYQAKFEIIWKELQKIKIAGNNLVQIKNKDLFKFSPYKSLTDDQLSVVTNIINLLKKGIPKSNIVSGEPGTGKTIVATYLVKAIQSKKWAVDLKVGLVVPMTALRKTLRKVFKQVKGLKSSMVIGPNDVVKDQYDVLIVDEAHRLHRRVNLNNYKEFDRINRELGLPKYKGTQLDWIMKSSKFQVLFYDEFQSIKPSDIRRSEFDKYDSLQHKLVSQMRVRGGDDYIQYISNILNVNQKKRIKFDSYEFKIYDNIKDFINAIKSKDKAHQLSRVLAGYSWKWQTKEDEYIDYDIEIDGVKLKWNTVTKDWVNSPNAVNEVGCIHTIQGYDLNYAGVIMGNEISFDEIHNKIIIDKDKYLDFNGKRSITDPKELDRYVKNIYKTLLTRGILGTYVYIMDKKLREYMKRYC